MSLIDSAMQYAAEGPSLRAYAPTTPGQGMGMGVKPAFRRAIVIESPFKDEPMALHYLGECVKDSISRGEAPFASHGFYTRWLEDSDPTQRDQGIDCQLALIRATQFAVFYTDLGISRGMQEALQFCNRFGISIEFRELGEDWRKKIPVGKTTPPAGTSLGFSGGQPTVNGSPVKPATGGLSK